MADKKKSKWFRVATEGSTTDGRKIEKKWLQEMATTYNQAKYSARIFIEHIRGFNPNAQPGFRAMGDVLAVKVEEVEEGKLALFAQIDPTPEMVKMVGDRQKIYSSIEVAENFAGSGLAYLVGLGVTDSPASLGTDILAFAAQHPQSNPFASRKQSPENMISEAIESTIEFEDVAPTEPSIFEKVMQLFNSRRANDTERFADVHSAVQAVATETAAHADALAKSATELAALQADMGALRTEFAANKTSLQSLTDAVNHTAAPSTDRPPATGGGAKVATDC